MAIITQQAVILDSQNQLRNADRLAREWAVAHAGAYQSQARKDLGGSPPFREWKRDNLTIRIAKLMTGDYKQIQLYSVNYELTGVSEPYAAYVVTYMSPVVAQAGGYCVTAAQIPHALDGTEVPWGDSLSAGSAGLDNLVASINSDRSRADSAGGTVTGVASVEDLFGIYNNAVVLTEEGQDDVDGEELEEQHSDWAAVVGITASEKVALALQLPDDQLRAWLQSKIAVFTRYAGPDGKRLIMSETDPERATAFINEERERVANELVGRNAITLLNLLESVSKQLSLSMIIDAKDTAEAIMESAVPVEPATDATTDPINVAAQQRIHTLEDRLQEAETTIVELRERLAQYENYAVDEPDDDGGGDDDDLEPGNLADTNRQNVVLDAIIGKDRFPRLRFLTNATKPLADYGKPRPNSVEIIRALEAINNLAQAWYNTPSGAVGPWDNYFNSLTGWKHADDESDTTMAQYGEKRSFSDQEKGRHRTITRHLTYQGSSGGLQIYFDRDDVTDTFIVGYIGEHLPYATSRS